MYVPSPVILLFFTVPSYLVPSGKINIEGFSWSGLSKIPYFKVPSYVILFLKFIFPGPCKVSYHNSLDVSSMTAFWLVVDDIMLLSRE